MGVHIAEYEAKMPLARLSMLALQIWGSQH